MTVRDTMQSLQSAQSRYLLLLLPLAVGLVYWNILDAPFVLDDAQIFENNTAPLDWSLESVRQVLDSRYHARRVVPNLTLALNYTLHGADPSGYHLVNIAIHVLAALAVYLLLELVFSLCLPGKEKIRSREAALFAALLWAVHPLQTNAVTYTIQRMTSLGALFYLLAVWSYCSGRLGRGPARGRLFYVLAALYGVLALFSKENTAVLPITLLGCELFLLRPGRERELFSRQNLFFSAVFLAAFLVIGLLLTGFDPASTLLSGYANRDFTLGQRLLTEPRILFAYLGLLVLPLPSRLNLAHDVQVSTGLFSPPQTFFALLGICCLALGVVLLFNRDRLVSFALFWFLLNQVVESTFLPLMLMFEHRMYLPSVLPVGAAVVWLLRLLPEKRHAARWVMVAMIVLGGFATWERNQVWRTEISLWADVTAKSPRLAWARANLGRALAEKGRTAEAEHQLRMAAALDPEDGLGYLNLGVLYEKQGRLREADAVLRQALTRKTTDNARLLTNLAVVNLRLGRYGEAISFATRAREKKAYRYKPYDVLGLAYLKSGRRDLARQVYGEAARFFPRNGDPLVRLATIAEEENRLNDALQLLNRALSYPELNRAAAFNRLGVVHWRLGDLQASITAAGRALEIDPAFLDAYLTLGISYEDAGQQDEAFRVFRRGWEQGLDMAAIYTNWARQQLSAGNTDRAIRYLREAVTLEDNRPEPHLVLAEAYAAMGMDREAAMERQRAGALQGRTPPPGPGGRGQ